MRQLARFFVVARHFQSGLGIAQRGAMTSALGGGEFRDGRTLQTREAHLAGLMRFDTRRTEHHDGVADAFVLELDKGMKVFGKDAQRSGRGAFEKTRILVRNIRSMLRLELEVPWGHEQFSKKREPPL